MAKKANRSVPVQEVSPGANPYARKNSSGKRLGHIMGGICLLIFILFDQLWIGTLACAVGFGIIYVLQVFFDKAASWYASPYLYITLVVLALAYGEYEYGMITNLMTLN